MAPLLYLLSIFCSILNAEDFKCSWFNNSLDLCELTKLEAPIVCAQFNTNDVLREFSITPFNNSLRCTPGPVPADELSMIINRNADTGRCTNYLAKVNDSVIPIYDSRLKGWKFHYKNGWIDGGCTEERAVDLTYVCDGHADPYNIENADCSWIQNNDGYCLFHINIPTKYACYNPGGGSTKNTKIGGQVVLIFTILILFCLLVGYIWSAKQHNRGLLDYKANCRTFCGWCCPIQYDKDRPLNVN
eukprot:96104_1